MLFQKQILFCSQTSGTSGNSVFLEIQKATTIQGRRSKPWTYLYQSIKHIITLAIKVGINWKKLTNYMSNVEKSSNKITHPTIVPFLRTSR